MSEKKFVLIGKAPVENLAAIETFPAELNIEYFHDNQDTLAIFFSAKVGAKIATRKASIFNLFVQEKDVEKELKKQLDAGINEINTALLHEVKRMGITEPFVIYYGLTQDNLDFQLTAAAYFQVKESNET